MFLPSLAEIEREQVRRGGLATFVKLAWDKVDTSKLVWNWHHDLMCRKLESVSHGEIKRLIINVPPGYSKSLFTSVFWPAWDWTINPDRRWMCASYEAGLAERDARKCKELIGSDWFRERWPEIRVKADSRAVSAYELESGGFRLSAGTGGAQTGKHPDIQLVDDPQKPLDFSSSTDTKPETVWQWWTETMASRARRQSDLARVIIMQRLHEGDLTGRLLERMAKGGEQYETLCLPQEFDPEHPQACPEDPRTTPGELLDPGRFGADVVALIKRAHTPTAYAGQYGQLPQAKGGGVFKKSWIQYYRPGDIPDDLRGVAIRLSVDATFKGATASEIRAGKEGDFVAIQAWAAYRQGYYLLDQIHDRMGYVETLASILQMRKRYPTCTKILIEDKANGPAIIEVLAKKFPFVEPVTPQGGKIARAEAVTPLWSNSQVYIPHPDTKPWVRTFEKELLAFPRAKNDDQVDAMTQALAEWATNAQGLLLTQVADAVKKWQ